MRQTFEAGLSPACISPLPSFIAIEQTDTTRVLRLKQIDFRVGGNDVVPPPPAPVAAAPTGAAAVAEPDAGAAAGVAGRKETLSPLERLSGAPTEKRGEEASDTEPVSIFEGVVASCELSEAVGLLLQSSSL